MESYNIGEIFEKCVSLLGGLSGIFLLVVAGAKIFGKNLLSHWFAKDLEKYKSELDVKNKEIQNQLDTKLELVKIQQSALHSKRLDVLECIHYNLFAFKDQSLCLIDLLEIIRKKGGNPDDYSDEEKQEVRLLMELPSKNYNGFIEFRNYFEKNKLYLSLSLTNKIVNTKELIRENIDASTSEILSIFKGAPFEKTDEEINQYNKDIKTFISSLEVALVGLQKEFRGIIGIND